MAAIRARRSKTAEYTLRHLKELHNNIILEGIIEGKKTTGLPRNSYIGQIKSESKTFNELKEKANN